MVGILVLIWFMAAGVLQAMSLFHASSLLKKIWLGCVIGLMEMMWLPSLYAYAFDFTLTAQLFAAGTSFLLSAVSVVCLIVFKRSFNRNDAAGIDLTKNGADAKRDIPVWLLLVLVLPMAVLSGYLQYTHNLRMVDGAYHVGQSTYGDLCMHLSFATGLIGQSYSPEYTILPGTQLGYPFLTDALSATMLIFGTPLPAAFYVPGTVMTILIYLGFAVFAYDITKKKSACALAFVLFALNGGLGFIQTLDTLGWDTQALDKALFGYYQTPTNMPDENLRWVNALSDLIIPQRTLMAGWMCVIPALYLLSVAIRTRNTKTFVILGIFAGCMPMIHTHSFLALGAISLGAMIVCFIKEKGKRGKTILNFGLYGVIACLIAFPQLLKWTFPQTIEGGSLRILFNWVNNNGRGGLIDGYFWFWIKNVGIVFLFFLPAGLSARKLSVKAIAFGSLILFVMSEFVLFQPNVYDNIKLFFVAFIAMLPAAAQLLTDIYRRLSGIRMRFVLAAAFIAASTISGAITIARECISDYEVFSSEHVEAAEFIKENTPEGSVFLTANNHNNAPAALAGRKIVCGSSLYVHFHGLDYQKQETEAILMMAFPKDYVYLYNQYGVDYVYVSSYERGVFHINYQYLPDKSHYLNEYIINEIEIQEMYPLVYEHKGNYETIRIYAVSDEAIAFYEDERTNIIEG